MTKTLLFLCVGIILGVFLSPFKSLFLPKQGQVIVEKTANIEHEDEFPTLNLPLEYFDTKGKSISASANYNVLPDASVYQSYPSTTISLNPDLYSNKPVPLPPIKSDNEIHGKDPELDFMGDSKNENIQKYGVLARRFIGAAGEGWLINSVTKMDVDKDGEKETLISMYLLGANIGGQKDLVIKGDMIIFSTDQNIFSTLTPAKNGNGFFLQWADNFKGRDGYITTRFIFDGSSFIPAYEQKTRYIRVQINPSQ